MRHDRGIVDAEQCGAQAVDAGGAGAVARREDDAVQASKGVEINEHRLGARQQQHCHIRHRDAAQTADNAQLHRRASVRCGIHARDVESDAAAAHDLSWQTVAVDRSRGRDTCLLRARCFKFPAGVPDGVIAAAGGR